MSSTPPPHPAAAAAAAMPWHLAGSLVALKSAVDAHWPDRDKRSDGGIGDARHQAEGAASDHNPWLNNTVRAYDFTATQPGISGVDGPWLAECLRLAGAAGDRRLAGASGNVDDNGYVIWDRHITAPDFSRWVPYSGTDPHTTHVHVSATRDPGGYEDGGPWAFLQQNPSLPAGPSSAPAALPHLDPIHPQPAGQPVPVAGPHQGNPAHEAPAPVGDYDGPESAGGGYNPAGQDAAGTGASFRAQYGNEGPRVKALQVALNADYHAYSQLEEDGVYGPEVCGVVQDLCRRIAADPSLHDEATKQALDGANGDNVGPHLAAVLPLYGIHV